MTNRQSPAHGFVRKGLKVLCVLALSLAGIVAAYLIAAVVGTVWTAPASPGVKTDTSHTIYVLSNGFHSDIALPVVGGQAPHGIPVAGEDLPAGLQGTQYLITGWGSQTAYTSLLAVSDLTVEIIAKALFFDRSVIHIQPYSGPMSGKGIYRLELGDAQYQKLIAFIAQTFSTDDEGRAEPLSGITQGFGDVFYRAHPRFSMFYGCNAWTGEALRQAGVSVGRWTPFAQSIEWNMEQLQTAK